MTWEKDRHSETPLRKRRKKGVSMHFSIPVTELSIVKKENIEFPIAELALAIKARHTFTLGELKIAVKKKKVLP